MPRVVLAPCPASLGRPARVRSTEPRGTQQQTWICSSYFFAVPKDVRRSLIGNYENFRDGGELWSNLALNSDGSYSFHWYNLMNERNQHSGKWEYDTKEETVILHADQQGYGGRHKVTASGGGYMLSGFAADKPLKKK